MRIGINAAAALALLLAGCFNPSYDNGSLRCSPAHTCPDGYECADDDRCYEHGALPDLSAQIDMAIGCGPGTHLCGVACASDVDPATCGVSCSPCATLANATTSCDGTACQYTCVSGYKTCNGACISASDDTVCNGGCNPGFHLCNAMCLSDSDVNHCGTRCTPCVPAAGSSGAALCVSAGDGGVIDDGGIEDYICVTPNCTTDSECATSSYCDHNGVCQPRRAQGVACNTTSDCKVTGCRVCAAATAGCVEGVCCDTLCAGGCDACAVASGATTDGTCAPIASGSPGSPSCSPYVCNGAASCPVACAADADCIAADYCGNDGACHARVAQGTACDTTADCKVAGCRECAATTAGCVNGFCCNTTCVGACDACSVLAGATTNGTCGPITAGLQGTPSCTPFLCGGGVGCPNTCATDNDCVGTAFCNASGACQTQVIGGLTCNTTLDCKVAGCRECGTGNCSDGVCCDQPCNGSCNVCTQGLGAPQNGVCTTLAAGATGSPSCTPFLCGGGSGCAGSCSSDNDCAASAYCDSGNLCKPRKLQGDPCNTTLDCKVAGCHECQSMTAGCVDGFCCDAICDKACDACASAATGMANGTCAPVTAGSAGTPSCTPLVCNGAALCPALCAADTDCIAADYCDAAGVCQPQKAVTDACDPVLDCKVAGCRECPMICMGSVCL